VAKIGGALAGGGLVAGATLYFVLGGGGAGPSAAPGAWIDDPLHGAHLPPGAVAILAHAADPDGIAAVELSVNNAVVATQPVTPAAPFASAQITWNAVNPGAALLRIRARDANGEWGRAAYATIQIDGPAGVPPPPTNTPPPTTSAPPTTAAPGSPPATTRPPRSTTRPPTTTRPPAPTQCTTLVTPGIVSPANNAVIGGLTPTLRWSYSGPCPVTGFTIQVSTDMTFQRVTRTGTVAGGVRAWIVAPALLDCQTYYWRVRATIGRTTLGPWSNRSAFVIRIGRCP
jgi:hypothetical protein